MKSWSQYKRSESIQKSSRLLGTILSRQHIDVQEVNRAENLWDFKTNMRDSLKKEVSRTFGSVMMFILKGSEEGSLEKEDVMSQS